MILIEGVMGLHDGNPSSADLARLLNVPVAFVINCSGMAQSMHAIAHGLATYKTSNADDLPPLRVAGVVANNIASPRHEDMLREANGSQLKMLAALRRHNLTLPSRHLGLMQASEIVNLDQLLDAFADRIAATDLGELPPVVQFPPVAEETPQPLLRGITIGIARDSAFSFIYQDNLDWLAEMGAQLKFFSPLTDASLPVADAIYLPGGYPELYADALWQNASMRGCLSHFCGHGGKIYAECGGMLYLLESLTSSEGQRYQMLGLVPGSAEMRTRLSSLGYQLFTLPGGSLRGHTFHYSHLDAVWKGGARATKYPTGEPGELVYQSTDIFASYIHFYFRSAPRAVATIFDPRQPSSTRPQSTDRASLV